MENREQKDISPNKLIFEENLKIAIMYKERKCFFSLTLVGFEIDRNIAWSFKYSNKNEKKIKWSRGWFFNRELEHVKNIVQI